MIYGKTERKTEMPNIADYINRNNRGVRQNGHRHWHCRTVICSEAPGPAQVRASDCIPPNFHASVQWLNFGPGQANRPSSSISTLRSSWGCLWRVYAILPICPHAHILLVVPNYSFWPCPQCLWGEKHLQNTFVLQYTNTGKITSPENIKQKQLWE